MRPRYTVPSIIGAGLLAATALAGCGGSSDASSGQGSSGSGAQGSSALTITSPKNGATVTLPFTVKYTTSEQLGPTTSGRDHVHVYLDGKKNEYTVVPTTSYVIKNAPTGMHEVDVSLQHADHSPVGPTAHISVNITGAGSGGSTGGTNGGNGGGGYDYGNGSGGNGY